MTILCPCGTDIADPVRQFGDALEPVCWECYSERSGEDEASYGLGPHHHDLSITGSLIGSTIFDEQKHPDFTPDPDAPGLGMWYRRAPRGWR